MKIGIMFPGQGSQYIGMGRKFYESERIVQECFEQANACLDTNIVKLCFASSDKELKKTIHAQISIFLISTSIFVLLEKKYGLSADIVAGHSLGEYSALFAAGGISYPDALYLLQKRSFFMDKVVENQESGMLAVIGVPFEVMHEVCRAYDTNASDLTRVAEVVIINSPRQVVVSGTQDVLGLIREKVKFLGGRSVPLKVAGAFHSRLMRQAEEQFVPYLVKVDFKDLKIPVINNAQARPLRKASHIRASLAKQTSSAVLWWQSMQHFKDCDLIIEVGPGTTLSRILKAEWPEKNILAVNEQKDIDTVFRIVEKY